MLKLTILINRFNTRILLSTLKQLESKLFILQQYVFIIQKKISIKMLFLKKINLFTAYFTIKLILLNRKNRHFKVKLLLLQLFSHSLISCIKKMITLKESNVRLFVFFFFEKHRIILLKMYTSHF